MHRKGWWSLVDKMKIEILDDGTIKTSTDKVSMPNHANAEGFLREIRRLAGGKTESKRKTGHHHTHSHTHEKGHQ